MDGLVGREHALVLSEVVDTLTSKTGCPLLPRGCATSRSALPRERFSPLARLGHRRPVFASDVPRQAPEARLGVLPHGLCWKLSWL